MPSFEQAVVVIPAYNEQRYIAEVIDAVQQADPQLVATERLVVVDNNSTDATAEIANSMGAIVQKCAQQGKGWAMREGAEQARSFNPRAFLFLDADLIGLKPEHVNDLVRPVLAREASMVIGYLGGRISLAKEVYKRWGALSGQRALTPEVWGLLRPRDFRGWRIEGALNAALRSQGRGDEISRIELDGLRHIGKRDKADTLLEAGKGYLSAYGSGLLGLVSRH